MKNLRLLFSFLLLLISGAVAQAQLHRGGLVSPFSSNMLSGSARWKQQIAQPQAVVYRPGQSVQYGWENGKWTNAQQVVYSYDAQARPTQEVYSDSASKTPISRITYSYDAKSRPTSFVVETWTGTAWTNASRLSITFDSFGDVTKVLNEAWMGSAWVPLAGSRYTNTRTAGGLLQEIIAENLTPGTTNTYVKTSRELYTVTNGKYSEVIYQNWSGTAWVNNTREYNYVWSNWDQQLPASYVSQTWKNNAWADESRTSFTYTANGGMVELTETRTGNAWVNSTRQTQLVDNVGNSIGSRDEDWNGSAWVISSESKTLLTYGANDRILRSVEQNLNLSTKKFENSSRVNYSDFKSFTVTASRQAAQEYNASLYPNPAQNSVTLELSGLRETAPVRGQVINQLGQVVSTHFFQPKQGFIRENINLETLPRGLYSIRLFTSSGAVTQRLVHR